MAVVGIQISLNSDEFRSLREQLGRFLLPPQATSVIAAALRKAIAPAVVRLRELTPVGPTGNLKRAVSSKVIEYKNDGVAVALAGYTRAGRQPSGSAAGGSVRSGKDRAYHQWWLEYGTDERKVDKFSSTPYMRRSPTRPYVRTRLGRQETVRGTGVMHVVKGQNAYIASSFNKLGPFKIAKPEGGGAAFETDPPYPRAFFKKKKDPITIRPTPAGGIARKSPVNTTFLETQDQMASILERELSLSIAEAWAALRFRGTGTVTGTDTLGPG
jgi:hypothetical protein